MGLDVKRICAALSRAALFLGLMGATLWRENVLHGGEPRARAEAARGPRGLQSLR